MRYSRFDEARGMYEIFEDSRHHAINADWPVPRLGRDAGKVGVPAIEAGRALPPGARLLGEGWHPEGLIVPAKRAGSAALGEAPPAREVSTWWVIAGAVAGAAIVRTDSALIGSVLGGGLGYLGWRATQSEGARP